MNIIVTFDDRNQFIEPNGFRSCIQSCVDFFNATYSDNVRINIDVGYGFVGHKPDPFFGLGASSTPSSPGLFNYAQLKSLLQADAKTSDDTTAVASLQSDPFNLGSQYTISRALSKALGVSGINSNDTTLDGSIGIGTGFFYDTDRSDGITAGAIDLFGVFAHELTEVLGRGLNEIGNTPEITGGPHIEDLFHYSDAAGHQHTMSGTTQGYFSINGGTTNLGSYNTKLGGDFGDWADPTRTPGASKYLGNDSFNAFSDPTVKNEVSENDLIKMDIIGYDRQASSSLVLSARLSPTRLGDVGDVGIYRLDLGASGLKTIQSITIHDDNIVSGGTGGASGLDLDFIELSNTATSSPSTAASLLPGLNFFDFSAAGVKFQPGYLQPWSSGQPAFWNTSQLFGTTANQVYSQSLATLNTFDGSNANSIGAISFGEGGFISFTLKQPVSTQGLFLYFGDVGGGNDDSYVFVGSGPTQTLPTGITITGTSGDDDLRLGVGINAHLGTGDDIINGGAGNDQIAGAGGNDVISGGPGNDTIDGGTGTNTAIYSGLRSNYIVTRLSDGSWQITDTRAGSPDGTDNDLNIQNFQFADQTATPSVFAPTAFKFSGFAPGAGGWSSNDLYPRELADVNGDHNIDIVGFGDRGVYVALGNGDGSFGASALKFAGFGAASSAGGWISNNLYLRELADVNGDGMADIVGFGERGVSVALATGGGGFGPSSLKFAGFGAGDGAGGWSSDNLYPRALADVNGDHKIDIVGFGDKGVSVALGNGDGSFGASSLKFAGFGAGSSAGGWSNDDLYPRQLADVNGDGMADIVGFGDRGVSVALATGGGSFAPSSLQLATFGAGDAAGGWISNDHYPRELADVNGDGKIDIVGFGEAGVYVAFGNGDGSFKPVIADVHTFGAADSAGGWNSNNTYPRQLADVNHDGAADIVAFGYAGVYEALSNGFHLI